MKKIIITTVVAALAALGLGSASAVPRCQEVRGQCPSSRVLVRAEPGQLVQVTVTNDGAPALLVVGEKRAAIGIGSTTVNFNTIGTQLIGTGSFTYTFDPTDWKRAAVVQVLLYECPTVGGVGDDGAESFTVTVV